MNLTKNLLILSIISGIAATGQAQEPVKKGSAGKHAIRVAIRNAPGVDEIEEEFAGNTDTYNTDAQDGVQVDIMYVKRFMGRDGLNTVGPLVGGGIFISNQSGDDLGGTDEVELTAFGLIGEAGIAIQLGRVVVLEAAPFLGVGGAEQKITGFSSGAGGYFLYGAKGGIYFQIGEHIELGLEAGYSGFISNGEIDYGPITSDVLFTGGGSQAGGVFVVKF